MLDDMLGTEFGMNLLSKIVASYEQPSEFPETRQSSGSDAGPAKNWKDVLYETVKQYHPGPLDALRSPKRGSGA
jgi:hypothetical protein